MFFVTESYFQLSVTHFNIERTYIPRNLLVDNVDNTFLTELVQIEFQQVGVSDAGNKTTDEIIKRMRLTPSTSIESSKNNSENEKSKCSK